MLLHAQGLHADKQYPLTQEMRFGQQYHPIRYLQPTLHIPQPQLPGKLFFIKALAGPLEAEVN